MVESVVTTNFSFRAHSRLSSHRTRYTRLGFNVQSRRRSSAVLRGRPSLQSNPLNSVPQIHVRIGPRLVVFVETVDWAEGYLNLAGEVVVTDVDQLWVADIHLHPIHPANSEVVEDHRVVRQGTMGTLG